MVPFLPNGRKQLSRFSLFAFDYIGMETISKILNENTIAPVVEVEQESKPYVFIIDEINRGNISKIFGELITLIEDTKRAGAAEAMEATLPYSGESFSVPKNVYILGTMNTADRSIALLDTALRRRFEFKEMMPDSEVLERLGVGTIVIDGEELNVAAMLDMINRRIEYLFDREHTIGHAFFTKLADDPSLDTLAGIFEKNVIPLLQEYFYEDYEKIQLILGDNAKDDEFKFILDKPLKIKDIFNGNPDIDLPEKGYEIQHDAFHKLASYKLIGKDL
jgi:5-methylcytosine-specific restriction protein B